MANAYRLPLLMTVLGAFLFGVAAPAAAKPKRERSKVLLGNTALASAPDTARAGAAQAFRYLAVRSGAARSIFVYVGRGTRATRLNAGVYADSHGRPGKLLAAGSRRSRASGRWTQVTLKSAKAIVEGRAYWIAVRGSGGMLRLRVRRSRSESCAEASRRAIGRLPAEWRGKRRSRPCSLSAYASGIAKPVRISRPTVSGLAAPGQTLTATAGTWRNNPTVFVYQWQACDPSSADCLDIPGATADSYQVSTSDVGLSLRVVVGAANAGGVGYSISALTAPVSSSLAGTLLNTEPPTVSGETVNGQTMTTTTGAWSATPIAYLYQWDDCDASGVSCTPVTGATSATYTLTPADVGHTMRVVVAAIASSGTGSAASGPTNVVTIAATHTETWAFDGCGDTASATLVRQWLTYAETNCGPGGDAKALSDCHSSGVIYCDVIQYLDTNILYYVSGSQSDQWPQWESVAQENWYLHEAPPNEGTRISTSAYGGGYYDNVANPAVQSFYQNYVRQNYPDEDGLMMDDTNAGINELLYESNDQGAASTNEITSSAQLQAAHQALQDSLTRPDGSTYPQITNGLADGGNPNESQSGVGPTGNQITTTAPGILTEGNPESGGSLDTWYPGLLDDIAYIDDSTTGFIVLDSSGAPGASYENQSRLVQEATVLLGYQPDRVVDWANFDQGNGDVALWPEEGIYPENPVQTMSTPGGTGCLAGTGVYCATGGHNDLEVATGVYRREFANCYDQGTAFGTCAAIVNTTGSPVTVSSSWLTQTYAHSITLSGGDVQSGGTINLTGAAFSAGAMQVPADGALILTGT